MRYRRGTSAILDGDFSQMRKDLDISELDASVRKAYSTPELRTFGSLHRTTQGSLSGNLDMMAGLTNGNPGMEN